MGHVFIARHGPTHKDELDIKQYHKVYAPQIKKMINKYGNVTRIYTSPIERCIHTAKILAKYLDIPHNEIITSNYLLRHDAKNESNELAKERAREFGHMLYYTETNILVVTHSSVLRHILEGVTNTNIKNFYINKGSLTIYDTINNDYLEFNHKWNKS